MISKISIIIILILDFLGISNNYIFSDYESQTKIINSKISEVTQEKIYSNSYLRDPQNLDTKKLSASGIVLLDMNSNTYLYHKNLDKRFTIASITKVATSLAILENYNLNEVVKVSYRASSVYGSKVYLSPLEEITVDQLVTGMLVASGNDAALALADHFGEDKLLIHMNQTARNLNLKDTQFFDAAGLSMENRSTPRDLATLAKAALSHPFIAKAVKYKSYTIRSVDGKSEHLIHTTNRLLKNHTDITGIKTGYTEEAGFCLISSAKKNNHNFLLVLLGATSDDLRFDESRTILTYAQNNTLW
ncbi:D-alanyl-D-alanine carboxypeptidase family protein [Patescibacteria group bacterium]